MFIWSSIGSSMSKMVADMKQMKTTTQARILTDSWSLKATGMIQVT